MADCEIGNITAAVPVTCAIEFADSIGKATDKADASVDKCTDTTGLTSCPFDMMPNPMCLGTAAASAATGLVEAMMRIAP